MNISREEIIKRYDIIKEKWDNDPDLRRILPDTYDNICRKLEGLKLGYNYEITDNTNDLKTMIAYVGGQVPCCNFKSDDSLVNINNRITYNEAEKISKDFNLNSK